MFTIENHMHDIVLCNDLYVLINMFTMKNNTEVYRLHYMQKQVKLAE